FGTQYIHDLGIINVPNVSPTDNGEFKIIVGIKTNMIIEDDGKDNTIIQYVTSQPNDKGDKIFAIQQSDGFPNTYCEELTIYFYAEDLLLSDKWYFNRIISNDINEKYSQFTFG